MKEYTKRDSCMTMEEVIERNTGMSLKAFLTPQPNPYIHNMDRAVEFFKKKVNDAAEEKEILQIKIVGDYDADGMNASAILYDAIISYLKANSLAEYAEVSVRLPRRYSEGYGLSKKIIDESESGLIITVENGDTLSDDKFPDKRFDYCVSNPPYGKKWEKESDEVRSEAAHGFAGRFGAGLPSINDGSMLFIQNMVAHMKTAEEGGSKGGIVLSASPLFNGDAGSGPSNIRRWLFQKDLVDCVVKLPTDIFFRTGINTYLWILNTKKNDARKGMIQLINASDCGELRRKSLGNKRKDVPEDKMKWIIQTYIDGHDHGKSMLLPVEEFMYRAVTVQRPLKQVITFDLDKWGDLFAIKAMQKLSEGNKDSLKRAVAAYDGQTVKYNWFISHSSDFRDKLEKPEVTNKQLQDAFIKVFGVRTESDEDIVYDKNGKPVADADLKDTEKVPYTQNINEYMEKEVYPYVPDAWVDESVVDTGIMGDHQVGIVGTQISFDKYFYHYEAPRKPEDIMAEIKALEPEIEEALKGVFA